MEYRTNEAGGHHFIKIKQNGNISDKNEAKPPRNLNPIFSNEEEVWHGLKDCPHAIFAVKNEHSTYPENLYNTYDLSGGLNFEDIAIEAIKVENSNFSYHNREYVIKEENGEKVIFSNGEIVAFIISDESGTVVVEEEGKHEYISNVKSITYGRLLEQILNKELKEKPEMSQESKDFELEL